MIEIQNLYKSFGTHKAVENLSLEIHQGEIFGFLGKNGAGKSTTLRCLLTLIHPDSGVILYKGKDVFQNRNYFLQNVGAIIEKPDFYGHLSGLQNLKISATYYDAKTDQKRISEVLELVGLSGREKDKVKTYSQGMKQRLGIAQAIIHDPELIILDEPTNGLDPVGMVEFRNIIKNLKNELKKTILVSSHILSEMELIMDSFILIDKGKNIIQGKSADLLDENEMVVIVETPQPMEMAKKIKENNPEIVPEIMPEGTLHFRCSKQEIPILHQKISKTEIPLTAFYSRKKLEDLFVKLTQN
jgi:ABC-type multidrug transport system ATPase subunit